MADENSVLEKFEENIDFHNGRYNKNDLPITFIDEKNITVFYL